LLTDLARTTLLLIFFLWSIGSVCQSEVRQVDQLPLEDLAAGTRHNFWLKAGTDTYSVPILVPVMVARGTEGPVLGLTAAIHGNELNGIRIIQQVMEVIDVRQLRGMIIGIPGLNVPAVELQQREYPDLVDLNRIFPGDVQGNGSEQYVHQISTKILDLFDVHIDMHTASFGRRNSLYVRADLNSDTQRILAHLQEPDIIVHSTGPSVGTSSTEATTMRAAAALRGIHSITVEYGDPQIFQPEIIERGVLGIGKTLAWLGMIDSSPGEPGLGLTHVCGRSFWIYQDEGGFLEVLPDLIEEVKKGQKIAVVRDPFGSIIKEYFAPEDGIVIGKSSNPVNMNGGRILHLGVDFKN
jgi:predicted deacylase